jgi:membrane protein
MKTDPSTSKKATAPPADDRRKPDNPIEISRTAWKFVVKRTLHEFMWDQCTTLAAALTYYAMLSLFPGLLALISVLSLFGQADATTATIIEILRGVADPAVVDAVREPIERLANAPGAGFAFALGLVVAIWAASGYVTAFSQAMNRIFEVDEGRPIWKLRPIMMVVTIAMLLIAIAMAVLLVVSGPVAQAIGDAVGLRDVTITVWRFVKWPVLVVFAVVLVALLYYATPNVKQPRFRWLSVGSSVALVVLALASLGFFFYVANFSNYDRTYGSIGGIIVLLLWLWIANMALLFGAEFDAELERARQLQGGIKAERTLQLPPRDDRQSRKRQRGERKDMEEGRRLREQHSRRKG